MLSVVVVFFVLHSDVLKTVDVKREKEGGRMTRKSAR
jgi:hypothetical protein